MEYRGTYISPTIKALPSTTEDAQKGITAAQRQLLADIDNLSQNQDYCYASNDYLAGGLHVSARAVQKMLEALEAKGYLKREAGTSKSGRRLHLAESLLSAQYWDEPPFVGGRTVVRGGTNPSSPNKKEYITDDKNISLERVRSASQSRRTPRTFVSPSRDEVKAYFQAQDFKSDANHFYDFYEGNGWKQGTKPIRNWQAIANTWEQNEHRFNPESTEKPSDYIPEEDRLLT